jgi:DNA polymerase I-like protein with 3'-5' exonuclease and polymerase domains
MSGAELRIIAEDSGDPVWILAFAKGEDVHSVGTELLYEDIWLNETLRSIFHPDKWTLQDCKDEVVLEIDKGGGKVKKIGPCAYYAYKDNGELAHHKCDCPMHKERRDHNKATNFLLAYGGGAPTLAKRIKQPLKVAKHLMALHEEKNPKIWAYLKKSGEKAGREFKAFDLYGRRRLLPEPTYERATENCKEYNEQKLRLSEADIAMNINAFILAKGRKPTADEKFELTHRKPTASEIGQSYYQMSNSIERQGKNMRIQGTNASIAKIAMGCGYDPDGKPFLWHTLPLYRAKLIKFVHDELVVQCPKQYSKQVAALIGDAFKRAAAIKMKQVIMEFDYNIAAYWSK